nr:MAG TPA: hypothetical protein [Myoviridae sp. ctLGX4]
MCLTACSVVKLTLLYANCDAKKLNKISNQKHPYG